MRYELFVPDISCGHCRNRISKALEELGVKQYEVSVPEKKVNLETENIEPVLEKLRKIGYPVESYRQL
ncbi:copper resistance protein CopZ [Thermotoga sp. Ku-13t]|uniref:heavy-metal-associated domain-containing protein n=1 Tax=Thermotoga sp. Ku-13t TaxID=1755813 RepID=UPI0013EBE308|nr:heavy-metal-associated domain-containing protein [Thermotoga sp. Ku-13t]KAF2958875.1 copper resistance protein CopZ [Thermotoga sp. Ku-13t]MBC7123773.1 heavy-metal-associated domain-containing protein [Pseudothermotoga sp.]